MNTFGERLRAAMLAAGIESPEQLAKFCKLCGVSVRKLRAYTTLIEADIPAPHLLKLSNCLHVRMRWLITGQGALPFNTHLETASALLNRLSPPEAEKWLAYGRRLLRQAE